MQSLFAELGYTSYHTRDLLTAKGYCVMRNEMSQIAGIWWDIAFFLHMFSWNSETHLGERGVTYLYSRCESKRQRLSTVSTTHQSDTILPRLVSNVLRVAVSSRYAWKAWISPWQVDSYRNYLPLVYTVCFITALKSSSFSIIIQCSPGYCKGP